MINLNQNFLIRRRNLKKELYLCCLCREITNLLKQNDYLKFITIFLRVKFFISTMVINKYLYNHRKYNIFLKI